MRISDWSSDVCSSDLGEISELRANEAVRLPSFLDYRAIAGLSLEMMERLEAARPENLAAAGRIRGITPAALAAILVHARRRAARSEEHTSELQSLMRISYAVFCLKKKNKRIVSNRIESSQL